MQVYGNASKSSNSWSQRTSVGNTLIVLIQDVDLPQKIHRDNAPEIVGRKTPFFKRARTEKALTLISLKSLVSYIITLH